MNALPEYVTEEYLSTLKLRAGCGTGEPGDRCAIQEVRAWEGLDPSNAECPPDADPLIVSLVIRIQDAREAWRKQVVPLLPLIPGSIGSDALQWRRLYRCADWQIRQMLPAIIDFWPELKNTAAGLRGLAPVVDRETAKLAADHLDRALAHDLALALALDRACARALALALDLARARALNLDPVSLISELLAMQDVT